jgi:hypothetical protein
VGKSPVVIIFVSGAETPGERKAPGTVSHQKGLANMKRVTLGLLATFVAILLVSGLLAYVLRDQSSPVAHDAVAGTPNASASPQPTPEKQADKKNHPLLWELFGPDSSGLSPSSYASWEATASRIALRFSLAAFLAALLAYRPRRGMPYSRRNPYVMAVVAGAMMMVVGDSAARAFGIFAAASLVRFRTNIRDPKEITVLLICLGVGLAAGVGRWDMAVILTVFVLLSLAILEFFEQSQVFRTMQVSIRTRSVDSTKAAIQKVFRGHRFETELRELDREDQDDPLGKLVYEVNLTTATSTNQLSEELFKADATNIDAIEWEQQESKTYLYK